jgi:hypothetical protein
MLDNKKYKVGISNNNISKARIFLFVMIFTLLISMVSADELISLKPTYNYKFGNIVDIKNPCYFNGANCPSTALCNITVYNPDNSILVDNQQMTYNPTYFNYTLPDTNYSMGSYTCDMGCTFGGNSGTQRFYLNIGTGYTLTDQTTLMYVVLIAILIITFILLETYVFNPKVNFGYRVALFNIAYFVFIVLVFFIWKLMTDFLPDITYLTNMIYYVWLIPLLISWIVILISAGVLINSSISGKRQNRLIKMGYSREEAENRMRH